MPRRAFFAGMFGLMVSSVASAQTRSIQPDGWNGHQWGMGGKVS
jgi:hypothetical protein